ncbi:MAG: matrixin family metalloprotease [Gemmatimonadales bacterium]
MPRMRYLIAAALALGLGVACSEIVSPARTNVYEWRLFVPYDSAGPRLDSLTFHWPRSSLPVRYWVEDSLEAPAHVRAAIQSWKNAFLYDEFDGVVVSDSMTADVIVRVQQPPLIPVLSGIRLHSLLPECEGATDVDTVTTRFEFRLPVRIYLNPRFLTAALQTCLEVTATHEVGHSLGLFDHTLDTLDIMYSNPRAMHLSDRDIETIEAVYHLKSDMVPVRP